MSQSGSISSQTRPPLHIQSKPDTAINGQPFSARSATSATSALSMSHGWPERLPGNHSGRYQSAVNERGPFGDPWQRSNRSGSDRLSYPSSSTGFPRVPRVPELLEHENDRLASAARFGPHIAAAPSFGRSSFGVESPLSVMSTPLSINRSIMPPTLMELNRMSEKEKMLLGRPYRHWWDQELNEDREKCRLAVDHYNNACRPSQGVRPSERAQMFFDIIGRKVPQGHPMGSVGERVLVDAPFHCDYGYNLHIGDDVILGAHCVFQDPCRISIGDRCIIGPNVKFYGMTMTLDPTARKNPSKLAIGGSITIEEDCFIGGDVVILGHRTIKRGSTVGAGTVVSKDVPSMTVVAGSPMRTIRGIGPGQDADKHREPIQSENNASATRLLIEGGFRGSKRL